MENGRTRGSDTSVLQGASAFDLLSPADRQRFAGLSGFDDVEDVYPLSRTQAGMLFHSDYGRDRSLYHDIVGYTLGLPWDEASFRRALAHLSGRHPVFRTAFDMASLKEPVQLVHRRCEVPLTVEDLRAYAPEDQQARFAGWMEAEKRTGFDWTVAPLLRAHVQQLGDCSFRLALSFHHAILDGWSVGDAHHRAHASLRGHPRRPRTRRPCAARQPSRLRGPRTTCARVRGEPGLLA